MPHVCVSSASSSSLRTPQPHALWSTWKNSVREAVAVLLDILTELESVGV